MKGELKIMASADLYGLGATESEPVCCSVSRIVPRKIALPWLLIIGLTLMRRPVQRSNFWILGALACSQLLICGAASGLALVSADAVDVLSPVFQALALGLAGMWLLSARLEHSARWKAGLKMLAAAAGIGAVAFILGADFEDSDTSVPGFILLFVFSTLTVLALVGTAWACRNQCPFAKFIASFFMVCFLATFAILFAMMGAAGAPSAFTASLAIAGSTAIALLVLLMPFLIVSFHQEEWSERFTALLHLPKFGTYASQPGGKQASAWSYREMQ